MFDLKKPCDNCPFRRVGGVRLTTERAHKIASLMLSTDGGAFWCHKTTVPVEDAGDNESNMTGTPDSQHCAGALIFAEKHQNATQAMRIAERLRLYNAQALMADTKIVSEVFDTLEEMAEATLNPSLRQQPSTEPRNPGATSAEE